MSCPAARLPLRVESLLERLPLGAALGHAAPVAGGRQPPGDLPPQRLVGSRRGGHEQRGLPRALHQRQQAADLRLRPGWPAGHAAGPGRRARDRSAVRSRGRTGRMPRGGRHREALPGSRNRAGSWAGNGREPPRGCPGSRAGQRRTGSGTGSGTERPCPAPGAAPGAGGRGREPHGACAAPGGAAGKRSPGWDILPQRKARLGAGSLCARRPPGAGSSAAAPNEGTARGPSRQPWRMRRGKEHPKPPFSSAEMQLQPHAKKKKKELVSKHLCPCSLERGSCVPRIPSVPLQSLGQVRVREPRLFNLEK